MGIYWLSETDLRELIEKLCSSICDASHTVADEVKKLREAINRVNNNVKSDGCNSQSEQNTEKSVQPTVDDKSNEFSNTDRSCVENIIEQKLKKFKSEIYQKWSDAQEKRTEELECAKEDLKKEKEELKGELKHVKKELTEEKIKTKELECVKDELENEKLKITALSHENQDLLAEKVKVIGELERVKKELEAEKLKTNELDRVKEELSKKIIDVNQKLEEERKKSSNLELRNIEYQKEKEDTMRQLNELTIQKEQVAGVVGKFEEINSSYKSLLEKVIKCESMKDFSISKRLDEIYNSDSPEKILEFRSIVGNEYSFAIDVCNALKNFKKKSDNPQPVTQDEIELIDEVNEFYKKREKRTDESDKLLYLPKGFNSDNVSGARVPFLSSEMMDISNPLENQFEYISDVYTPCFKKYDSISPLVKALVKGRIKR